MGERSQRGRGGARGDGWLGFCTSRVALQLAATLPLPTSDNHHGFCSFWLLHFFLTVSACIPGRLVEPQDEALGQVQSILGCSSTAARALLMMFSWDSEAVLGAYDRCCPLQLSVAVTLVCLLAA